VVCFPSLLFAAMLDSVLQTLEKRYGPRWQEEHLLVFCAEVLPVLDVVTERFAHRGLDGAGTLAVVAQRDEREHPLTSRRDLDWGPYDALQEWYRTAPSSALDNACGSPKSRSEDAFHAGGVDAAFDAYYAFALAAHSLLREGYSPDEVRGNLLKDRILQQGFAGAMGTINFKGRESSGFYKVMQLRASSWEPVGEWRSAIGGLFYEDIGTYGGPFGAPPACPLDGCAPIERIEVRKPLVVCGPAMYGAIPPDVGTGRVHPRESGLYPPGIMRTFCPVGSVGTALLQCTLPYEDAVDAELTVLDYDCKTFDATACSSITAACPSEASEGALHLAQESSCDLCDKVRTLTDLRPDRIVGLPGIHL